MAADTRSKRSSAIRMLRPFMLALPQPDGTIDQADRQATAFSYAGVLAVVVVAADNIGRNTTARLSVRGRITGRLTIGEGA